MRARRALVLAAGYGTRLRPLTDQTPKPLLPVLGRPLVGWTLDRLAAAGCEAVALNLHHLGERIPAALGTSWQGMPLTYSEEPEILGTLGALAPLAPFFAGCDAVAIVNGDSLCSWPLKRLLARHRRREAAATLLLARRPDPDRYGGGVAHRRDGRIVSFRGLPAVSEDGPRLARNVFAGAHLLSPRLLARAPHAFADTVADLYEPLLAEGELLQAVTTRRAWYDLGTPGRYLEGALAVALAGRAAPRARMLPESRVVPAARLRRSVVERRARVEAGARLVDTLVMADAHVGEGARLERVIVGPGVEVAAGASFASCLLTRGASGVEPEWRAL
jgi:NDP-sugar pyrophosphorylase family protein